MIWSPRPFLRVLKTPRSRSRNFCPLAVPGGSFHSVFPSIVGDFDLRAQRCFGHRYGDRNLDVIAFAAEYRVGLDARRDVQITGRRAHRSGITFARHAQPRTRLRTRRNPHIDSLFVRDPPIPMTCRASVP